MGLYGQAIQLQRDSLSGKFNRMGFYTIGLFVFLHKFVEGFVNGIPMMAGKALGGFLAVLFTLDFANAFYREKREALPKQLIRIREGILNRFSR